ncbi:hypothetical protein T459_08393 [Capsicum annuum]|uniref:Uncharacterized protein n=1 Tax=Capsicum annuum TaxID=4072 RepID=A0A2G2ZWD1_CAPAN|nr:hypothetical protein T459_08393 [Capsicum annuum]
MYIYELMQSKTVAYDEGRDLELKKELFLGDALSDLPSIMQSNTVAYNEGKDLELKKELFLGDALSDVPLFMMEESSMSPLIGILLMLYLPLLKVRLVGMNYQARMGMMAAGAYGLPQFRMRVFMFVALLSENLPQYPLPTHKVIVRGVIRTEFEDLELKKELFLGDALSDSLQYVENSEPRDEISYTDDLVIVVGVLGSVFYDHRPLQLNEDDHQRVCQIPKRKGANFRDLTGVPIWPDKKVEWDPDVERVLLPLGKPLVPDYAMSFVGGSSSKSFGRLWWDETVSTVVRRA